MKKIIGTIDVVGPHTVNKSGTATYNYITVRKENGQIANLTNLEAFVNVQSAFHRILQRDEAGRKVVLSISSRGFIYAIENEGTIYSDVGEIRKVWLTALIVGLGPWAIAAFLLATGGKESHGIAGILSLVGCFTGIIFVTGMLRYWPGFGAGALHKRSKIAA